MESKAITVDGKTVSLRLMDQSYVMCDDERNSGVIVDVECRHMSPQWPNPLYSAYYRKLLGTYGVGPVLAWQNRRVVGFLPMTVPGCGIPEPPLCVHYTGGLCYGAEKRVDLSMIENSEGGSSDQLESKVIRLGCMSVHRSFRGKNLAMQMVRYMVNWAREHGWDQVRARAMLDGEPQAFYPTSSWWMGLEFESIGTVRPFGPSKGAIDQSKAIDLVLDLRK